MSLKLKTIRFKLTLLGMFLAGTFHSFFKKFHKNKNSINLGLVNIEYFHKEIGIYGGYGHSYKNIVESIDDKKTKFQADLLLSRPMPYNEPVCKRLDIIDAFIYPDALNPSSRNIIKFANMVNRRNYDVLLTMEYYSSYFYPLMVLPRTPLIIWIHDPRPDDEWDKINAVPLIRKTDGKNSKSNGNEYERRTLKRLLRLSKIVNRKILFGTSAKSLIPLARRTYDLPDIDAVWLPTPCHMPELEDVTYSERPKICFLGRLDPVKRPWIFFELAKMFPDVEFVVAGATHFKEHMDPIIQKYKNLKNLKFLGLVTGKAKDELLRNVWCIVNTSIHEALPVSFVEALSYGKTIVACHNPDNLVSDYGFYTGEILGEGNDEKSLEAFSAGIRDVINNREKWKEISKRARQHVESFYSYEYFFKVLEEMYADIK